MLGLDWKPFNELEEQDILSAIADAEVNTSGEIRVHVDRYCKTDVLVKAKNQFVHLEMDKTRLHNGVLIYIAIEDRRFAIVGDEGIDAKVESTFWDSTQAVMTNYFSKGEIINGICKGIEEAGKQLKKHYPYESSDKNELPDDISYG